MGIIHLRDGLRESWNPAIELYLAWRQESLRRASCCGGRRGTSSRVWIQRRTSSRVDSERPDSCGCRERDLKSSVDLGEDPRLSHWTCSGSTEMSSLLFAWDADATGHVLRSWWESKS